MSAIKPNPLPHFHQCGRVHGGWLEGYGCGHLWQHQAKSLSQSSASLCEDHRCPECNCGPWYYQLSLEEVESAKTKSCAV